MFLKCDSDTHTVGEPKPSLLDVAKKAVQQLDLPKYKVVGWERRKGWWCCLIKCKGTGGEEHTETEVSYKAGFLHADIEWFCEHGCDRDLFEQWARARIAANRKVPINFTNRNTRLGSLLFEQEHVVKFLAARRLKITALVCGENPAVTLQCTVDGKHTAFVVQALVWSDLNVHNATCPECLEHALERIAVCDSPGAPKFPRCLVELLDADLETLQKSVLQPTYRLARQHVKRN